MSEIIDIAKKLTTEQIQERINLWIKEFSCYGLSEEYTKEALSIIWQQLKQIKRLRDNLDSQGLYCSKCKKYVNHSEVTDKFHTCGRRVVPRWSEEKRKLLRAEEQNKRLQAKIKDKEELIEGLEGDVELMKAKLEEARTSLLASELETMGKTGELDSERGLFVTTELLETTVLIDPDMSNLEVGATLREVIEDLKKQI
jgi:hypothetical protein